MALPIRILYLSPCRPDEKAYGTQLRTMQMVNALQSLGQLDLIVVKQEDNESKVATPAASQVSVKRVIKLQPVSDRSLGNRVRCGLDPKFMGYYGHTVAPDDRAYVESELPNYDLIWLHHLRTANMLNRWVWPRSVMDVDDVPSTYQSTILNEARGPRKRFRARFDLMVAQYRERFLAKRFKVISVCSEADREYLNLNPQPHVIPNGFTRPTTVPVRQPVSPPRIGFIGTFDYVSNVESMRWFVSECWPLVRRRIPAARLRLIGRRGEEFFGALGSDIDALGWVADPAAEISSWSAMVVPVRTGAGTRVKIAEGFSRKCPIVSTSLGAFGYGAKDGREIFLADTAADFSDACVRAIQQPEAAAAMAERGWQEYLDKWTWDAIRPRIHAAAEDCLRQKS